MIPLIISVRIRNNYNIKWRKFSTSILLQASNSSKKTKSELEEMEDKIDTKFVESYLTGKSDSGNSDASSSKKDKNVSAGTSENIHSGFNSESVVEDIFKQSESSSTSQSELPDFIQGSSSSGSVQQPTIIITPATEQTFHLSDEDINVFAQAYIDDASIYDSPDSALSPHLIPVKHKIRELRGLPLEDSSPVYESSLLSLSATSSHIEERIEPSSEIVRDQVEQFNGISSMIKSSEDTTIDPSFREAWRQSLKELVELHNDLYSKLKSDSGITNEEYNDLRYLEQAIKQQTGMTSEAMDANQAELLSEDDSVFTEDKKGKGKDNGTGNGPVWPSIWSFFSGSDNSGDSNNKTNSNNSRNIEDSVSFSDHLLFIFLNFIHILSEIFCDLISLLF